MLDWILHVKTNALWKNVDYNASSTGNNLNTMLVQKEATVVSKRNIFSELCIAEQEFFLLSSWSSLREHQGLWEFSTKDAQAKYLMPKPEEAKYLMPKPEKDLNSESAEEHSGLPEQSSKGSSDDSSSETSVSSCESYNVDEDENRKELSSEEETETASTAQRAPSTPD